MSAKIEWQVSIFHSMYHWRTIPAVYLQVYRSYSDGSYPDLCFQGLTFSRVCVHKEPIDTNIIVPCCLMLAFCLTSNIMFILLCSSYNEIRNKNLLDREEKKNPSVYQTDVCRTQYLFCLFDNIILKYWQIANLCFGGTYWGELSITLEWLLFCSIDLC